MNQNTIQTLESYPDRNEIRNFQTSCIIMNPMKSIDDIETYQVNYKIPPVWFLLICLLLPAGMFFIMDIPPMVKYIMIPLILVMIPLFIFTFNKLIRGPLKAQEVRFKYDKRNSTLSIPHLELEIKNSNILEFPVVSGTIRNSSGHGGAFTSELSLIYKEDDKVKRVALFLAGKTFCTKTAQKLTEYTGKKNSYEKL